jgi:hypothetical protein
VKRGAGIFPAPRFGVSREAAVAVVELEDDEVVAVDDLAFVPRAELR